MQERNLYFTFIDRRKAGTAGLNFVGVRDGKEYIGTKNKILNPDSTGTGEIVQYSRNLFMGYHKEEQLTREAFTEDYWYRSGDIGSFDSEGYLTVSGRLKEIIITAGGKNIAPIPIEDALKDELKKVVSNAVIVGEKQKYLTCLLTLRVIIDQETQQPTDQLDPVVIHWAKNLGCHDLETVDHFINGPHSGKLSAAILQGFNNVNSKAESNVTRVQKFTILPKEFSINGGELGPTLKMKRYFVYEKYSSYIDAMYVEVKAAELKKEDKINRPQNNLAANRVAL